MTRFMLRFMLLLLALFALQITQPVQQYAIFPFTALLADISAWIVQLFDHNVIAYERILRDGVNGFAVEIAPGCNGVEAVIILAAAICAFPAPWRYRLIGLAIGFIAIQSLNLVRIISLFYLGQYSATAFKWFHLYVWQAMIMLDALVVWLVWLRYLPRRGGPGGDLPAATATA